MLADVTSKLSKTPPGQAGVILQVLIQICMLLASCGSTIFNVWKGKELGDDTWVVLTVQAGAAPTCSTNTLLAPTQSLDPM